MLPWHTTGIYDEPETFGLRLVAWTLAPGPAPHEDICPGGFDYIAMWVDDAGHRWLGNDSGCACPVPFENHHPRDLWEVANSDELAEFVYDHWQHHSEGAIGAALKELEPGLD